MIEELVIRGVDDWLMAADVAWIAKSVGGAAAPSAIRELSIELIHQMVQDGLVEIGDVDRRGFHPWVMSHEDALSQIRARWSGPGPRARRGLLAVQHREWRLARTPALRPRIVSFRVGIG